jgi:WD40 repeat protein
LGSGIIESVVLQAAWAPSSQQERLVIAGEFPTQPTTPEIDDLLGHSLVPTLFSLDSGGTLQSRQFPPTDGAFFGACFSPRGDLISCATGREIIVLDAKTLSLIARLDSFYSATEPRLVRTPDSPGHEASVSGLGFTLCHAWSPATSQAKIAAGNVGGLRYWDAEALAGST